MKPYKQLKIRQDHIQEFFERIVHLAQEDLQKNHSQFREFDPYFHNFQRSL